MSVNVVGATECVPLRALVVVGGEQEHGCLAKSDGSVSVSVETNRAAQSSKEAGAERSAFVHVVIRDCFLKRVENTKVNQKAEWQL